MSSTRALPLHLVFLEFFDGSWRLSSRSRFRSDINTSVALVALNEPRGPPFGQTTGDNPRLRFSARTLRATRLNARSARATKTGGFFAPLLRLFLFILRVIVGRNLHHRSQKSRRVSRAVHGCPRSPNESQEKDNHQPSD